MTTLAVLENLTAKLPLGVCVLNEQLEIEYWNDFFADRLNISCDQVKANTLLIFFFKYFASFGKKINSVFVLNNASFSYWEHRPHVFLFSSSRPITGEETLMYQNIEFIPLHVSNNVVKTVCMIVQDVTELASYYQCKKQLSEELAQEHSASYWFYSF